MKSFKLCILIFAFAIAFNSNLVKAQDDDDCCDDMVDVMSEDEWQRQMNECDAMRRDLLAQLDALNAEIDQLRRTLADRDVQLQRAEDELLAAVGTTREGLAQFRRKFEEAERRINNCRGPEDAADIEATLFAEIEASRIKCLPEFWDRYLTMKRKLEECKGVALERCWKEYTVVRGDCLWRIAGRSDIYGNPRLWPKIWEANRDGVLSAPPGVPNRITNPNLIYPGQVLCIPALTEAERQMRTVTTPRRRARTK